MPLTLRESVDLIFSQIGTSNLTDMEFDALEIDSFSFDQDTYAALLAVLDSRESVSTARDRLRYLFLGRGAVLSEDQSTDKGSNILIGGEL